jgi:hypothetical protein
MFRTFSNKQQKSSPEYNTQKVTNDGVFNTAKDYGDQQNAQYFNSVPQGSQFTHPQQQVCYNMNITNVNVNLNISPGNALDQSDNEPSNFMQLDQFMSQMDNFAFVSNHNQQNMYAQNTNFYDGFGSF